MASTVKKKVTGYDKYVNWKIMIFPVALMFLIMLMPTPEGMQDVGTEYKVGPRAVTDFFTQKLFGKSATDVEQWQLVAARIMEQNMNMGAMSRDRFLKRDAKWAQKYNIPSANEKNIQRAVQFMGSQLDDTTFRALMEEGMALRKDKLAYDALSDQDRKAADKGGWHVKVAIALTVFVVGCFLTECMPLPGVAFVMGLVLVTTGVVGRDSLAMFYWSDSVWFIMGSLMFAAAFVKTGVDKRVCLAMFNKLAVPNVRYITLMFFVVITPLAAFISDHALAAMFLPIGMLLYQNSLTREIPEDPELGKMLMISIAMACNMGGPGAPSGGARNVIMMTYLQDMFGIDIGYMQWVTYCFPFLFVMIPLTWLLVNWRFKPRIHSLAPAMEQLRGEIDKMGGWSRQQIWALVIFVVMVFGWFTEKSFYDMGIYPVRLGIGTVAVGGAIAYLLAGVTTWRDYQDRVDWGVVWLYAGAILFGRILDETGAAYWLARSALEVLAPLGINAGLPLMAVTNGLTGVITNLMADGPAAAAVGPVVLNVAGLVHPGSTFLPFIAMGTAMASSFAYCLIIGTPPNAIVYASGYLGPKDFLRVGVLAWICSNVVLILLAGIYWKLRGFAGLPGF
ncbi:MAG: DASS family sodium-coupled anion symporter [Desulfobacteraceae bacterium]|nr:MAG: DASS family sodium-coupled anion symporter [Desulfobacteraceae bacterium]